PDGQTIAIGHLDGTVRFWDAGTGRPARAALPAARAKDPPVITCLAFSPDGRKLAVGLGAPRGGNAADGVALLWDLSGEQPSPRTPPPRKAPNNSQTTARAAAWTPDGKRLLTGHDVEAHVWTDAGEPVGRPWPLGIPPTAFAFSSDGRMVLVATGKWWVE